MAPMTFQNTKYEWMHFSTATQLIKINRSLLVTLCKDLQGITTFADLNRNACEKIVSGIYWSTGPLVANMSQALPLPFREMIVTAPLSVPEYKPKFCQSSMSGMNLAITDMDEATGVSGDCMPIFELDKTGCGQVIDTNLSSVAYFLKWANDQARHDVARLDKVASSVLWLIAETSSYV
ncbi:uncharacterized protein BO96DRAFT_430706 [Aspergillus niger CBS 101883]|uniref:uncharacterized protein n=1 Tax=Aspergillus lacticoffeatus (strain CBS 101883) TaxID=1450533 RepID=UPI000D7FFB43|nr:uncharacterized protein BO96DRAFT_430706 [Aspergillus niger CBS 101883]PYH60796.1 hypothetical protein BO96DRAFT_430706 [Aspergillus niger CBS 101883]